MKTLLIGGNGFIGSHVLDIFLREQKSVKVFDKSFEVYRKPIEGVEYIQSSFDDTLALTEALTDVDCVVHALSTSIPSTSNKFPVNDIEGNLVNTLRLLDIMLSQGIKRVVFLSSGGTVYGIPTVLPVPENHETNPICSYGIVKLTIEKYLLMYSKLYDLRPIILRISNPFGPRQSHYGTQGFISTMINNFTKNQATNVFGDGKIIRDNIFITDVARACYLAAISDRVGIYNVGSGFGLSLIQVVEMFERMVGKRIQLNLISGRTFDVSEIFLAIDKIENDLGWKSEISIADGMKLHLDWLVSQHETRSTVL